MRLKRMKRDERLCDAISFRISPKMREFLETMAEQQHISICEAARIALGMAMAKAGGEN